MLLTSFSHKPKKENKCKRFLGFFHRLQRQLKMQFLISGQEKENFVRNKGSGREFINRNSGYAGLS